MEGEETERLAGFTARAASAPDGLQSGREIAGSCSVYMPSSRLLPRGSERVYDYAGGREERKRNVVDVPKYAPFRLLSHPSSSSSSSYDLLFLSCHFPNSFLPFETVEEKVAVSLEQKKDATRSLAIVRFEIVARASCESSGRNVSRGRRRAKNYFGTTTRLFGESRVRESSDTRDV